MVFGIENEKEDVLMEEVVVVRPIARGVPLPGEILRVLRWAVNQIPDAEDQLRSEERELSDGDSSNSLLRG